ncbi:GTP-binding protein LepA [Kwoniella shandongensis]|uniref:GTP-binding protein LepA n=1 Tax=Kwoniella shandongensis TaxID=1734106 RepID=A0A5M6BVN7_9TREE|nr:GTP-binding protein LepA [Kwoniella shandongensis]KAA5525049.1 GTP-binding protein LepA [Kwoniella shandongensis]
MSALTRSGRLCLYCTRRLGLSRSLVNPSTAVAKRAVSSFSTTIRHDVGSSTARRSIPAIRHFSSSDYARARAGKDVETIKRRIDMSEFPPERIRNLSIIAHIDHGKSTLADRLLQMTGTVPASSSPQFLDKLKVERERGITVKAQTVSLIHTHTDGNRYLINIIDTPGHVDFSYEVSRSLGACEGGLLLVDCSQGIQAQTLSVFHHALEADLSLLAVVNKVDLPHASPVETSEEIESSLGLPKDKHMRISAKSGLGVKEVLTQIVEGLPSPKKWESEDGKLRGLIFDTFYDQFRGVVSLVRIFSGTLKKGDKIRFIQANSKYEILEVGIHNPEEVPVDELKDGQVGYMVCNMKNSEEAFIGDTICWADKPVEALPGFKPMKAMVYAGVFPMDSSEFPKLEESIERLTLNDRSVSVQRESSAALSQGFRLGFLGTLHMDVFRQRLEDEYASEVIVTAPTVPYKVVYLNGSETFVSNPVDFPEVTDSKQRVAHVEEPMINSTIFVPNEYIGEMMDLCSRYRGVQQEYRILENSDRAILRYSLPLSEIVTDFFSELKSSSSGFASFDYEEAGYQQSDLVKLNILINAKPVDALAMIVHRTAAQSIGKAWVKKLKEVVPRQQFELSIQAAVGARVIARENVSAFRKDVTAGLYGGHYDRKLKHLNKQKAGKKRLKMLAGNIAIPQTAFFKVLSSRPKSFSTSARSMLPLTLAGTGEPFISIPPPNRLAFDMSLGSPLSTYPTAQQGIHDPVTRNLPDNAPVSSSVPETESPKPNPIARHTVPPPERSTKLATLARLNSIPSSAQITSTDLHQKYTDLYLSSPQAHLFTVAEVQDVIRALHTLQQREGGSRALANEQLTPLFEELRELVGDDTKALRGLELLILSSKSLYNRKVKTKDILRAEAQFKSLFKGGLPPSDNIKRLETYKASINQLMYLCALAGHETRLNDWWDKMTREGLKHDTYSFLTRLVLLDRLERVEEIPHVLEEASAYKDEEEVPTNELGGEEILVNFALWAFARIGRWDAVVPVYAKIRPRPTDPADEAILLSSLPQGSTRTRRIPIPEGLRATRRTYSPLLRAMCDRANFSGALTILKHIFEDGHSPSVIDYVTLFRAFSDYGEIPSDNGELGEVARLLEVDVRRNTTNLIRRRGSFEERISEIWQSGSGAAGESMLSAEPPRSIDHSQGQGQGGWTLDALEELFESFLTLHPSTSEGGKGIKAPNRKAIWIILKAFARTTGGDDLAVKRVWEALETKFGEGNGEGWIGWREDNRLVWLKRVLYTSEGGDADSRA